jgi:hypothetical protein
MIGNEVFNPLYDLSIKGSCRTNERLNLEDITPDKKWPTYQYSGKKREIRGFIHSCQTYSYAKTSLYYFVGNVRIIWCSSSTYVKISGKRYTTCSGTTVRCTFNSFKENKLSVAEKYEWYINGTYPNYLGDLYFIQNNKIYNAIVFSYHDAPGSPKIYDLGL